MNKFIPDPNFEHWKIVATALKCCEKNLFLTEVIKGSKGIHLNFNENANYILRNSSQHHMNARFTKESDSDDFMTELSFFRRNLNINTIYSISNTTYYDKIADSVKNISEFENKIPYFRATCGFSVDLMIEENKDPYFDKADEYITKFSFLEQNIGKILTLFGYMCAEFNTSTFKISLNKIWKLKKYIHHLEHLQVPTKDELESIIFYLKSLWNSGINNFNFLFFNMYFNPSHVTIYCLGNKIFDGKLDIFKYIKSPGLNFMTNILLRSDQLDKFKAKVDYELLRKL